MIYLKLFFEFFKIGLFSVGGGMATVPFLYDLSDKTGWYTHAQLVDMIAVSESTPGPIGLNMATYVGYTTAGSLGSVLASLGMIVPGILIVLTIVRILNKFRDNKYVDHVFYGLRPTSAALIASAGVGVALISLVNMELYRQSGILTDLVNLKSVVLAVIIWILTNKVKKTKSLHPILYIAASAIIGVLLNF